jgi:hypothetical protein
MRGYLGWFLLLPLVGAFGLTVWVVRVCVQKGGFWRLVGVLASLFIGGICIFVGWVLGLEEGWIIGWVAIIAGGLIAAIGAWSALLGNKGEMERTELEELTRKQLNGGKLGKRDEEQWEDMWKSAKEEAKRTLEQDEIDNYERFSLVRSTLAWHGNDSESFDLYQRLNTLQRKSTIEEAKRILEQGKFDNYKKKDWERFYFGLL